MTNGTKLITGNHLENASVNAKRYILAELLTLTNTITAELNLKADDEVFSAGASGIVPAPTANDADKFLRGDGTWATPTVATAVIGSASSTVEGAFWLEES